MKKTKILSLIISFAIILSCIAFTPSCSFDSNNTNDTNIAENSNSPGGLLEDLSEQAQIYKRFLDNIDLEKSPEFTEIFYDLKSAIENIDIISGNKSVSEDNINNIADEFNTAAENFRAGYFDLENAGKLKDSELINKLYIGDVKCAYDEKSQTFYYTMGLSQNREFKFDFYIESGLNAAIVFAEIYNPKKEKTDYRFIPELNKEYILKSYSDKNIKAFYEYKIIFTVLPIIQIESGVNIGDNYKDCVISVTDPDFSYIGDNEFYANNDSVSHFFFESTAKIHIRGGISRGFPKKAYAVKFVDDKGENKDIALFDMRNDSDWILDAMYIDKARLRNRISTDIWNDYNSRLYYMKDSKKAQTNGTNGIFVEVFLNDGYIGLYCFTEKIDRKQLRLLKDENKSYIYKGKWWDDPILFRKYYNYSDNNNGWGGFVQKFPNPGKGGKIKWEPIANFVDFGVNSSDKDFADNISRYIDIDNFVDYVIFLCISYAYDNTGKNCYWSVYDITDENLSKFFLTPWDMDASWGRSWDGSKVLADKEWMDSESYEHDSYLFRKLIRTNAGGFKDKLISRWEELKDNILSPESLVKRFDVTFDLFDKSGAWEREGARWGECNLDLEYERKYIRAWTFDRWDYIDDFIRTKLDTLK